jgi:hypothetical protein
MYSLTILHQYQLKYKTDSTTNRSAVLAESRSRIDTQSFITTAGCASRNHGKVTYR